MAALTLSGSSGDVPGDFSQLFDSLGARPQPAVVFYGDDDSRIELSGRVLTNWAIKLTGLLTEEYELSEDSECHLDTAPHWKAAAVILAVSACGARVTIGSAKDPDVVVTDRPSQWLGSHQLGDAELAALSAGMLDSSFEEATGESIPAWVLDISADAPGQPDQLISPLPPQKLPALSGEPTTPLVMTTWDQDSPEVMIGTWAHAGTVVLFSGEPTGDRWEHMRRNEGLV